MSTTPSHHPTARELDDLELLVGGALAPLTSFNEPGSPVTLELPADVSAAAEAAGAVELVDPEGLPLARVSVPGWRPEPLTHAQFGPYRRLYLSPAQVREQYAGHTFVPVVDALTTTQLESLSDAGAVALLALVGTGTPDLSPVALLRATLAAARHLGDAVVVAVPLAAHGDVEVDHALGEQVVSTFAGPDPIRGLPAEWPVELGSEADPALAEPTTSPYPADIADIVAADRPEPDEQGLVLFFTGLSGSGKSTLAQALMDRVLEQGLRTITSLDGDVVRRNLSAGLSFSKQDRETNIRRIGWVAAEISRHGGLAVVSPIAPFDETRQQVRAMVDEAGGAFFLVHVATPLEECERRDRKGLYAKARRGEIPEFTGISSPYEEPEDADVRVDTTGRSIDEALDDVIDGLADAGYLDLRTPAPAAVGEPLKVLFVCTANICRSPFMELVARRIAGPGAGLEFASAGTHGLTAHPMDDAMAAELGGYDVASTDGFRSRPLTADLLDDADLVLTAETTHRAWILEDNPGAFRKVFTLGQFAQAAGTADPGLTGRDLLAALGERRGAADESLDVSDPYRQGPAAAQATAALIDELLRVAIPALTGSGRISP